MSLSENIIHFRKLRNMTQLDLSKKLNISHKTISSWESGRTKPNVGFLIELSNALGVSMDDLMESEKIPLIDNASFAMLESFNSLNDQDKKLVLNIIEDLQNRNK